MSVIYCRNENKLVLFFPVRQLEHSAVLLGIFESKNVSAGSLQIVSVKCKPLSLANL